MYCFHFRFTYSNNRHEECQKCAFFLFFFVESSDEQKPEEKNRTTKAHPLKKKEWSERGRGRKRGKIVRPIRKKFIHKTCLVDCGSE